jgi:hypothetical protein
LGGGIEGQNATSLGQARNSLKEKVLSFIMFTYCEKGMSLHIPQIYNGVPLDISNILPPGYEKALNSHQDNTKQR